jgi:hypothetical protein
MRFLESAMRSRVLRRENAAELGLQAKFVVIFSVTIGTPKLASQRCHDFSIFFAGRPGGGPRANQASDRAEPEMQPAAELLPAVYAELPRLAAGVAG